jgi:hypothetical protein
MNRNIRRNIALHTALIGLLGLLLSATIEAAPSTASVLKLDRETLTPQGISVLELNNRVGSIVFQGSPSRTLRIHAIIKPQDHSGVYFFGLFSCCSEHHRQVIQGATLVIKREHAHTLDISLNLPHDRSLKHVKVDWSIEVPEDLGLLLRNHVGLIRIHDVTGTIQAHNNVGSIKVSGARAKVALRVNVGTISISGARHSVSAHTNVGSIHVLSDTTSIHRIALDTNVGSLHLSGMPAGQGSGSTSTSIPVGGTYRYTGTGRDSIRLKTNIGAIDLSFSHASGKHRHT